MPRPNELVGWKAIAVYLGVGIRTAQEYEKDRGLPVYHQPGEKGRVFAKTEELDEWRSNKSRLPINFPESITTSTVAPKSTTTLSRSRPRLRLIGVCLGSIVIVALSCFIVARHLNPKEPSR